MKTSFPNQQRGITKMPRSKRGNSGLNTLMALLLTATIALPHFTKAENPYHNGKGYFSENRGQFINQDKKVNTSVLYGLTMPGLNVALKKNGFSYEALVGEEVNSGNRNTGVKALGKRPLPKQYVYKTHRIDVEFLGSNPNAVMSASDQTADYKVYYLNGLTSGVVVHNYQTVTYRNIYPGIDIEFVAQPGTSKPMEYNFILHPGSRLSDIRLRYTGASAEITKGNLVFKTRHGNLKENIPGSWLKENNQSVKINYTLISKDKEGITVGLSGNYKTGSTLIVDPTPIRDWGTYFGGSALEYGYDNSVDDSGHVYLTGYTESSSGIHTTGAHLTTFAGNDDMFLAKYDENGNKLWSTYYGGSGYDYGYSIDFDNTGNVYVAGITTSTSGIATGGTHQGSFGGGLEDAFVVKFTSSGTRIWGTYYGGGNRDFGLYITVDNSNNVYLAGATNSSSSIATAGSHKSAFGGTYDGFLVKLTSSGTRTWGTYYGGSGHDEGYTVSHDATGNIYLTGFTSSTAQIHTTGAHKTAKGGTWDAYAAKFNTSGVRQWGTYYGGSGDEFAWHSNVDDAGNLFITGQTDSDTGIATGGSHQSARAGNTDAFIVKFNTGGVRQWGTYYGGTGDDFGWSVHHDDSGYINMGGVTNSTSGIASAGSYQTAIGGGDDGFFGRLSSAGSRIFCSYYGGSGTDYCYTVSVNRFNSIYISGYTESSSGIATTGASQSAYAGLADAFLAKFGFEHSCGAGTPYGANEYTAPAPSGEYVISTQAQMDAFFSTTPGLNYGNKYTKVNGSLIIDGGSTTDPITNLCNLNYINEITRGLTIRNFNKTGNPSTLDALNRLTKIGCTLYIHSSPELVTIALRNVESTGCAITISNNANAALIAMDKLSSVRGDRIMVSDNPRVTGVYFSRNAGSFGFTGKGSSVIVTNNGGSAIGSTTMDFKKVKKLRGQLLFSNNNNGGVSNFDNIFTGLDSLQTSWGNLTITNNAFLGTCCVAATTVVAGTRTISGNTGNCANIAAVVSACGPLQKRSVENTLISEADRFEIQVTPNPNNGTFNLYIPDQITGAISITIYDMPGKMVFNQEVEVIGAGNVPVTVPDVAPGQYIVKVKLSDNTMVQKMMMVK